MSEIRKNAKQIANLIIKTDTDERGTLFLMISEELRGLSQGYVGRLFKSIAMDYGFSLQENDGE